MGIFESSVMTSCCCKAETSVSSFSGLWKADNAKSRGGRSDGAGSSEADPGLSMLAEAYEGGSSSGVSGGESSRLITDMTTGRCLGRRRNNSQGG